MNESIFAHMDFFERPPQPGEKMITRKEFHAAVQAAVENVASNPKVDSMAKVIYPLMGMTFAAEVEEILFGKKEG